MSIFRNIGLIILAILLCPFFLIFFTPIIVPYILQSRVDNCCLKFILVVLGLVQGLIMIPFFILACILYFIYYMAVKALSMCGCDDCCDACCSVTGYPYGAHSQQMHSMQVNHQRRVQENEARELRQLRSVCRSRALLRIRLLSDPLVMNFSKGPRSDTQANNNQLGAISDRFS